MHVVFLTRKFPPQTGGMETFSWQLTRFWQSNKTVVSRGSHQRDIFWVAPVLLYHAWRLRNTADVYHLGDAVLAPLAPLIRLLTHKPVVVTVHGLELTYSHAGPLYHAILNWGLRSVSHCVCVSDFTASLLRARRGRRGSVVSNDRISVIPHGVVAPNAISPSSAKTKTELAQRYVLLTVGRLVKRKGAAWFVEHVLPLIRDLNPLYIITSTGPDSQRIRAAVSQQQLQPYVRMVGNVSAETLERLYATADVFVMPNIAVQHDVEGFGFVAVEAAAYGLPVVASNLEGIPQAIHNQKNGMLYPAGDARACAAQLRTWHANPVARKTFGTQAQAYTLEQFRWDRVAQQYADVFARVIQQP